LKKANLHEAKTNLSKLIELVVQGEEVIICKAGRPIAKLISFNPPKEKRKGGAWKGKVTIAPDFDELPSEFIKYFNE
jgi:prevent-host-death family protein